MITARRVMVGPEDSPVTPGAPGVIVIGVDGQDLDTDSHSTFGHEGKTFVIAQWASSDYIVVELNSDGTVAEAKRPTALGLELRSSGSVASSGMVYVTGFYNISQRSFVPLDASLNVINNEVVVPGGNDNRNIYYDASAGTLVYGNNDSSNQNKYFKTFDESTLSALSSIVISSTRDGVSNSQLHVNGFVSAGDGVHYICSFRAEYSSANPTLVLAKVRYSDGAVVAQKQFELERLGNSFISPTPTTTLVGYLYGNPGYIAVMEIDCATLNILQATRTQSTHDPRSVVSGGNVIGGKIYYLFSDYNSNTSIITQLNSTLNMEQMLRFSNGSNPFRNANPKDTFGVIDGRVTLSSQTVAGGATDPTLRKQCLWLLPDTWSDWVGVSLSCADNVSYSAVSYPTDPLTPVEAVGTYVHTFSTTSLTKAVSAATPGVASPYTRTRCDAP